MIDTHCHIDLYQNPTGLAQAADRAGVSTVVVTNTPSAYERAAPHVRQFKNLRIALGLHPLVANDHPKERAGFKRLIDDTFYVGEVGLDFSREGYATRDMQVQSFQMVLEVVRSKPKFITLHSRRAEEKVREMLKEAEVGPVVFHWYSGSLSVLNKILADGHYLSINPAMVESPNGQKIIASIPRERVLTESDGPFVKVSGRTVVPMDVAIVEKYLGSLWDCDIAKARSQIKQNFKGILQTLKAERATGSDE
jgi:TatD DNase family protein